MQRLVKVDGKTRRDKRYPTGFMDVVSIDKTDEPSASSTTRRVASSCTASPRSRRRYGRSSTRIFRVFFWERECELVRSGGGGARARRARRNARERTPRARERAPHPSASAVARRRPQDERERSAAARPLAPPPPPLA